MVAQSRTSTLLGGSPSVHTVSSKRGVHMSSKVERRGFATASTLPGKGVRKLVSSIPPGGHISIEENEKESSSRGLRLLVKAKEFHVAARGLQETTGFRFMATQPPSFFRDANIIKATKWREWETISERPPPEFCRFWKLTGGGSINAISTSQTLFPPQRAWVQRLEGRVDEDAQQETQNKSTHRVRRKLNAEEGKSISSSAKSVTPIAKRTAAGGKRTGKHQQISKCRDQDCTTPAIASPSDGRETIKTCYKASLAAPDRMTYNRPELASGTSALSNGSSTAIVDAGQTFALNRSNNREDNAHQEQALLCKVVTVTTNRFGHTIRGGRSRAEERLEEPLQPLGWGWGGEFRLGTGRNGQEVWPKRLHPEFKKQQIVDVAAGKRITLFVSDEGLLFSIGEGLGWQLGTISEFSNTAQPRAVQRLPRQVHPSGELKVGKDFRVAQAAAGDAFCLTREANAEDAARATEGFLHLKSSVEILLEQSPSSKSMVELWENIMEEERTLSRRFEGRLLSWGSGSSGELGLGPYVRQRRTPRVVRALSKIAVRSVAAGSAHALCVSLDGKVFSWGRGQDGRLGHGDYDDRWKPCRIEGMGGDPITLVAAGKAHSMSIALPQAVYVWGRGAHGRLGTGDNRCRNLPVRLKSWPPGFLGCAVSNIALGGAHSLLLARRSVKTSLANPWSTESLAYAWGYGFCGQLGLGERVGEIRTPRKIAFDKKELITSIAAGKSFSLATSVQGQLFAWGKGWMGELGLGNDKDFRIAPAVVNFPGSRRNLIVKLAAGDRHATGLAVSCSPPAKGLNIDKQWQRLSGRHAGLKKWESPLLSRWRCPRRPPWRGRGPNPEPLFTCSTCDLSCVCAKCARSCHHGHNVVPCTRRLRVLCECGMQPCWETSDGGAGGVRGKSGVFAGGKMAPGPSVRCRLLMSVEDEDGGGTMILRQRNAIECQRVVRGWFGRRAVRDKREGIRRRRREAVEAVWHIGVLGAMERSIARFEKDEERERNCDGMVSADIESAFYRYYTKLQPAIQALNQQREAIRLFSTLEGVTLETPASRLDPRVAREHAERETITLWSRRACRQLERQLSPPLRLNEATLVKLTSGLPAGGWSDGRGGGGGRALGGVADPDVDTLLRSSQPLRKRMAFDIAAPEGLYERVTHMRAAQLLRLKSRRRASFSEGDTSARVDKNRTAEDIRWNLMLSRYWIGVDNSLGATRYLQITRKKCDKLTDQRLLRGRRGARALHKFLRGFGPGSVDIDVASVRERSRRGRAHSLCAPERLHAAKVTWESRHERLQSLLRAATRRGLPTSGDSMKWTSTAEKWGGLVPPVRRQPLTIGSLKKSARRIVLRAAKRGWDLRPASGGATGGMTGGRVPAMWSQGQAMVTGDTNPVGTSTDLIVADEGLTLWSAYDDGNGNTFYFNNVTGESTWEVPQTAQTTDLKNDTNAHLSTANAEAENGFYENSKKRDKGDGEEWWTDGQNAEYDQQNYNPYDGNDTDYSDGHNYGDGGYNPVATDGGIHRDNCAVSDTGDSYWVEQQGKKALALIESWAEGTGGGEGEEVWSQEWDDGSQTYYWHNASTGESRW